MVDALSAVGVDERDVVAVVNTHCTSTIAVRTTDSPAGPMFVPARRKLTAASEPMFTVTEWAAIPDADRPRSTVIVDVADGLRLLRRPATRLGTSRS